MCVSDEPYNKAITAAHKGLGVKENYFYFAAFLVFYTNLFC